MPIEKIDKRQQYIYLTFDLDERKKHIKNKIYDILYQLGIKDETKEKEIFEKIFDEVSEHYEEYKGKVRGYTFNFSTKLHQTFKYSDVKLTNVKSTNIIPYMVIIDKDTFKIKGIFEHAYYSLNDGYFNDLLNERLTDEFGEDEDNDFIECDEDTENVYDDDGNLIEQ